MIRFTAVLIFLLFPLSIHSQQVECTGNQSEQVITPNQELNKYDLVDPVFTTRFNSADDYSISDSFQSKPGLAFISSAIVPGSAQAFNRNWIRAGLFAAVEATAIVLAIDFHNRGSRVENSYERNADQNWSVVQYAQWLVEYHDVHNINNPYIEDLRNEVSGLDPAFDTDIDWSAVDINVLRNSERNTRYFTTDDLSANRFSHTLPAYGSQQYYELIAKYYQYQAGWRDYHDFHDQLGHTGDSYSQRFLFDRNGAYASPLFWQFADDAERFNDLYRTSRSFKMVLLVNHVASAFDALFTVQLKQNRVEATPSIVPGRQISMTVRF
jgi:hypothetical protein